MLRRALPGWTEAKKEVIEATRNTRKTLGRIEKARPSLVPYISWAFSTGYITTLPTSMANVHGSLMIKELTRVAMSQICSSYRADRS